MVSELEILARYYQIHLEQFEGPFFMYQGQSYFLTNSNIDPMILQYYPYYLRDLQIQGYQLVTNCFGKQQSEGYLLYMYQEETYSLEEVLVLSLKAMEKQSTTIVVIKESWGNIIDDARASVASHASRINHNEYYVILSYYYQGMAENAISILNEILKVDPKASLPVGMQHVHCKNEYRYICNPHNLLISTRIRDLALYYKNHHITIETVRYYLMSGQFSTIEIMYLYARVVFPSEFFTLILNNVHNEVVLKERLITIYNNIEIEKQTIIDLYYCIIQYVYIPKIQWIEYQ